METMTETTITESRGKWGEVTSPYDETRRTTPRAGDVVQFREDLRVYPVSNKHCRIDSIDDETGMVHIVNGMGSAFLFEDGTVSISGGPFFSVPLESLQPTGKLHNSTFWNWADNGPGAGHGVDYHIERPVFRATEAPRDHAIRYATTEKGARERDIYRHGEIPSSATLTRQWVGHDGTTAYLFDMKTASVYEEMELAGLFVGSHESDMHVKDTPQARSILKRKGCEYKPFTSETNGEALLDVPFSYDPFWKKRA